MEKAVERLERIQAHLTVEDTHASCPHLKNKSKTCPVIGWDTERVFPRLLSGDAVRVCVTGAAGNIAYSLIFMIASGQLFGPKQKVSLHLLDIPQAAEALKGVEMEIADCAFPLVQDVVITTDPKAAFMNVDVAILVGAFPRQKGMERKDLLAKNAAIFKVQGDAIEKYASRDIKVLVVGNPANTNALICMKYAPSIPRKNFSALTRLDHNRAKAQLALKAKVTPDQIQNVYIWGNHSATQYPDPSFGIIKDHPVKGMNNSAKSIINDEKWVQSDFLTTVQQRGAEIIKARKLSSAASAAKAAVDHVRDWLLGTASGDAVSMAVCSDGSYGVPKDLIYSFPVVCKQGNWEIVQNLPVSEFSKKAMEKTAQELLEERTEAFALLEKM